MQLIDDLGSWRAYCDEQRSLGRTVGLVPTMGALHEGHTSLFRAAKGSGDVVVATLFVNPRQFHDNHDLAAYPRTPEIDRAVAEKNGVDCLIEPALSQMWPDYPSATATTVSVAGLGDSFEAIGRPGHFNGVASVVAKLFVVTGPCRAYFGEKDYQQLAVVRQMARDLSFDVSFVACPIVRDADGLALSSRNAQLSDDARRRALVLSRALVEVQDNPDTASGLRRRLADVLSAADVEVAYADIVDPTSLRPMSDEDEGTGRALLAVIVDGIRLIDNGDVQLVKGGR
jgi:pantoate--beta-alanine ligase